MTPPELVGVGLTETAAGCLIGYGLVSLVNVTSEVFEQDRVSAVSLSLAMLSLVMTVPALRPIQVRLSLVVTALFFSWLGDWVGDLSATVSVKLACFLAVHICYAAAFWPFRTGSIVTKPGWCVVYTLLAGVSLAWVAMAAGTMSPAVLAYGCSVSLMAALATGVHPITAVGAGSFLISDVVIAVTTCVVPTKSRWTHAAIKASYLLGQLLIVCGTRARDYGSGPGHRPGRPLFVG